MHNHTDAVTRDRQTTTLGERLVQVDRLRPTQMAVGMRAVSHKKRKLDKQLAKNKAPERIAFSRPIPAVLGPAGDIFLVDHHHFALALWQAALPYAYVRFIEDLSDRSTQEFWHEMFMAGWLHPFDERGEHVRPDALPLWLYGLRHDPLRDLAWEVREAGGYQKTAKPFAEFHWANYLRRHISLSALRSDPARALDQAMVLAASQAASDLPGYLANNLQSQPACAA